MRVTVGSDVYDGSIRARLDRARTQNGEQARGTLEDTMPDLVHELEAEIAGAKTAAAKRSVGIIREIGDGVARIEGLADVMLNETLDFGGGVMGLALNLEETDVAAIILGDYTKLREGGEVTGTGTLLQVPVGQGLLGRIVNTLGEPLDGKGRSRATRRIPSRSWRPASSAAVRSDSRCRPASWRSTR